VAPNILSKSRIGVAAEPVGVAEATLEVSLPYTKNRNIFDSARALAKFEAIRFLFADMATRVTSSHE
jgi:alkylation response protein AidB-like acyl-CoA dehydrogenase